MSDKKYRGVLRGGRVYGVPVEDEKSSASPAGYVALGNEKTGEGVWFKSAITDHLYRERNRAGDIDSVLVDGVWYDRRAST